MLALSCGICLSKFDTQKALVYHAKHSCKNFNTFQCPACQSIFSDAPTLNLHLHTVHKGVEEATTNNRRKRKQTD